MAEGVEGAQADKSPRNDARRIIFRFMRSINIKRHTGKMCVRNNFHAGRFSLPSSVGAYYLMRPGLHWRYLLKRGIVLQRSARQYVELRSRVDVKWSPLNQAAPD